MASGVIKNPSLSINSNPATSQSLFDNTHHPKSPTLLLSPVFSPRSPRGVKTQATTTSSSEPILSDEETNLSFYDLLGIPEAGSFNEIKQAYKQMARKYHPDVAPSDKMKEYTQRFIKVQEAYQTLSDPNTRALYDRDMSRGLHLAFSARKGYNEGLERDEWRNQWQDQVTNLKNKGSRGKKMSWAAQMRQKRGESDGTE